jgi:hypothetical protein
MSNAAIGQFLDRATKRVPGDVTVNAEEHVALGEKRSVVQVLATPAHRFQVPCET